MAGILLGTVQVIEEELDLAIKKNMIRGLNLSSGFRLLEANIARELVCEAGDFSKEQKYSRY